MDLFERPELLPEAVKTLLSRFEDSDHSYDACAQLVSELELVGYTCEYYLDAEPYNLRRLLIKGQLYSMEELSILIQDVGLAECDYKKIEYGKMKPGAFIIVLEEKVKEAFVTFVFVEQKNGVPIFECVYTDNY